MQGVQGRAQRQLRCGLQQRWVVPLREVTSLPTGAKVLKAGDRSIVVAPLGHVIEEDYTVYLRFMKQAPQTMLV